MVSKQGVGSTFSLTASFELHTEDTETVEKKTKISNPLSPDFDSIRGANILLAEDNEINQEVIAELLRGEGFHVTITNNGAEAINHITHQKGDKMLDLVLMDLQMPVMDGYTAATILREYDEFNNLPIIAMTADTTSDAKIKSIEAGMDDYVTKPIHSHTLMHTLAKWITDTRSSHQFMVEPITSHPESLPLEGIDTQTALVRVNGNLDGYKRIL